VNSLPVTLILLFMLGGLMQSSSLSASSDEFATLDLQLQQDEASLLLDGQITFKFSKAALEALANGLPLGVETDITIKPASKWYWPKAVASLRYKQEIQYHALSQHYLVKAIGDDYTRAFLTQSSALAALGRVDGVALIDLSRLDPEDNYEVSVRSILDSESLPVPLRPLTYLSDEWRLRSDWKRLSWPEEN
jgi:hypothetical protein